MRAVQRTAVGPSRQPACSRSRRNRIAKSKQSHRVNDAADAVATQDMVTQLNRNPS
jgi:hypothetical protein